MNKNVNEMKPVSKIIRIAGSRPVLSDYTITITGRLI